MRSAACADDGAVMMRLQFAEQYCTTCHGSETVEGQLNLEQLVTERDFNRDFRDWERVIRVIEERRMPPPEMEQPSDAERETMIQSIRTEMDACISRHAGDPGPIIMRRLTGAEYGYTIADLTGLDLPIADDFGADAVGGAGFTNFGAAQFMQEATLEWYLEAAHLVASHAVIGAGPLEFNEHPGSSGQELAAIQRIQLICADHGIRTSAGEGAEPIGLDRYPAAFYVAWQYQHREALGQAESSFEELAAAEGVSPRFAAHIWRVLSDSPESFPTSLIVHEWKQLLAADRVQSVAEARAACDQLYRLLREWQTTLAASSNDEEEASVLTDEVIEVHPTHTFSAEIDWPGGARHAEFELAVMSAENEAQADAIVIWQNPRIRFRSHDGGAEDIVPLQVALSPESAQRLSFGQHTRQATIGTGDFVIQGPQTLTLDLQVPAGSSSARLVVDVKLDLQTGPSGIVRCRISDGVVEGETAAERGATSVLLADPDVPGIDEWLADVSEFARLLPEVTHREPAPSDRDPIPDPFDNTYNQPERTIFHTRIKYHRDDAFLVTYMLDDATRQSLDAAWTDLLTSFEYHDEFLQFVASKYGLDLSGRDIADLDSDWIDALPDEPRGYITSLRDEYFAMQAALVAAEPGHLVDILDFAAKAWRRPLTADEQTRLLDYYQVLRVEHGLAHADAIRNVLARILVSPAFLYRAEPPDQTEGIISLSEWELASRLSYFLWSSTPDEELLRVAESGELNDPAVLEEQARRMLRDPRAERLASEFFGQWFGFYRFDEYRGVDHERFPEFDQTLQSSLHQECVAFFTHLVREDRPIDEILFADYTFLNQPLARHYGLESSGLHESEFTRVSELNKHRRGGLLGLGAVLTTTSAPLRTSPVRRGDYILRRVLGTPVPPPPADAGSLPADDVRPDGLTVRELLEAHRQDASCINCHSRIDPLGFSLEHFDALGRWRDTYVDGQVIDDSGVFDDGSEIAGWEGVRDYLYENQELFHRTFCVKLLSYALGRTELLSDRPLIENMLDRIEQDGHIASVIVQVVTSRQFRFQNTISQVDTGQIDRP